MPDRGPSLTTLLVAAVLALLVLLGLTERPDRLFLDAWFRLRGFRPTQGDIIIVKIEQDFVDEYNYRIGDLDRSFYARALANLSAAGARVIGVDLFFPELSLPRGDRNPDAELAEAILSGNVVLPQVRTRSAGAAGQLSKDDHIPFHPLLGAAQRGVLSLDESAYDLNPQVEFRDGTLPSFPLAIVQAAGLEPKRSLTSKLLIDYRGPSNSFPSLSFLNVYRNQFSYADVQDKLVLLGVTLEGTDQDQIVTPFGLMPGAEVNANSVYTLLHGQLIGLPRGLYAALLLLSGLTWPYLVRRKRSLSYVISGIISFVIGSFFLFLFNVFFAPLWFVIVAIAAYTSSSYRYLLALDVRLSRRLSELLDTATLAETNDLLPTNLAQGFAPQGYVTHAPDMLESLLTGLDGDSGLLLIDRSKTSLGEVSPALRELTDATLQTKAAQTSGTMPHHVTEPIFLEEELVGVVALTLPHPLPPHLRTLLRTSVSMFSQLARYQHLRERTETLADTLWPWGRQSSLNKIDALAMVGDLLATERSWLGALCEALTQAVFIMSPYGYSVYANAAARRLFGTERNMLQALPEALKIELERFQKAYVQTVERGEALELGLTERDTERPVLLTLRVIHSEGEVKGVVGTVSDLSKVEELDRKRQELIGMVVHDLRSPLTSVQGFAEILLEDAPKEDQEYLSIISQEAMRMRRMTDVFLDMVKLESGEFTPDLTPSNVAELLRYGVATVSAQAAQKDILISVNAPNFLEAMLDPDFISRMITNLLSNAIKYSPAGTQVSVSLLQEGNSALLEVRDEGFGMSEAQLETLFQKYKRASEGEARAVTGTGLGLYLVKLVADAHGGKIDVESELKKGSTFKVSLPLETKVPVAEA